MVMIVAKECAMVKGQRHSPLTPGAPGAATECAARGCLRRLRVDTTGNMPYNAYQVECLPG